MDNQIIRSILEKNRPNLSEASLKGYVSVLKNLYVRVARDVNLENAHTFFKENAPKVVEYLIKEFPFSTRKTKLASLVVFVNDGEAYDLYRKHMKADWEQYKDELENQEKTEKMKKNWITQEELKELYDKVKRRAMPLFRETNLTFQDLYEIQKLVVLSIYTLLAPRRLLDYTEMKIRNFDKKVDNYWEGASMFFSKYKTAKTYGKEQVSVPPALRTLLTKWRKINPTDYLLFNKKGQKLTQPKLTLLLNEILGKGRSVNILRHSFITEEVLKDMPKFNHLKEVSKDMGNSVPTMMMYKKS